MLELSSRQELLLKRTFQKDNFLAAKSALEVKAGKTIPFCGNSSSEQLDRIRFAIIKLSGGCTEALDNAIELAHTDWRKLLISADFGVNPIEHDNWFKEELDIIVWWRC